MTTLIPNTLRKSVLALAAVAAFGGTMIAGTESASARPAGFHRHHHHGHFGHHRGWRGYGYGVGVVGLGAATYVAAGPRCRLVERINRFGEVVVRRVCVRPVYY